MNKIRKTILPMNIQMFAEEESKAEQAENGKAKPGFAETEEQVPSFDELLDSNKKYQSAFDRKVTQALEKAKIKWEESAKEEANEAKKLEKMSEAQRAQYAFDKEKAKFEQEKAAFAQQQLKTAVASELVKRGYSAEFAEFLTGDDADSSNANIKAFETAFKKAVETGITDKLRGDYTPPAERQHTKTDVPPEEFHAYEQWRKQNA